MATPHVAGVVALIQAVATTPKTPAQVEALIKGNVTAFPSTPSQTIGPGILNAKAVVDATNGTTPPPTGNVLIKGVAATGLGASTGGYVKYTMDVPAGATRALTLARRYPERYRALILIAAPSTPTPQGLAHLKGAVMMAGGRDRQDNMKAAARAFARAKVPSTFLELPEAAHGEMGPEGERVMGAALRWLEERASPSEPSPVSPPAGRRPQTR